MNIPNFHPIKMDKFLEGRYAKNQSIFHVEGEDQVDMDTLRVDTGPIHIERPFYIIAQLNNFCFDVYQEGVKDGTAVCVYPRHFKNNQLWVYTPRGEIKSIFNGLVIDIKYNNMKEGTHVWLWKANGGIDDLCSNV
jgi:hypothetical protein